MASEKLVFDVLAKASGAADVKRLGDAFDSVAKSADDLGKKKGGSLFKDIEKDADSAGKSIDGKFKSLFQNITSGAAGVGKEINSAIGSGLSDAGPIAAPLTAALVGAGIAAAPALGATVAAALIAGIGLAGIGAGIALQMSDPQIAAATQSLGDNIMTQLRDASGVFKQPILDSLAILGSAFQQSLGNIQTLFNNTAGFVTPLATAVGGALTSITAGVADLSGAAGPVLTALASGIQMVGDAIGQGFSSLADDGAAAATALQGAFVLITIGVKGLFAAVDGLTAAFGWLAEHGALGPGIQASYQVFQGQVANLKTGMDQLGSSTTTATNAMIAQQNELKAETDPIFGLITAQNSLKTAQDAVNTAIKQHGADSAQAKTAENNLAQAAVDLGQKTAATAGTFNGEMPAGMRATLEAANLTKPQIDAIAQSFTTAKSQGDAWAKTYTAHVVTIYEVLGDKAGSVAAPQATTTFKGYAQGGIDLKMATGGALESHFAHSPTVMYGERGDEAYIAKDANIGRSRAIAQEVVEKWLGGQVSWGGRSSGSAGASSGGARSGGSDTAMIVAAIQELGRNMGGDVYLDSRKVGSVQGRESDLYSRAG